MQPRFKTTHTTPDKLLENVFPPVAVSQLTVQTDSDEEIAFLQTQVDGEVHLLFSERISDHAWVNSDDLAGAAYSNHQWVTLQALLVALDTQNNIIVDNNREFSIYPPLWNLLLQKNTLMTLMSERRRKTCKPMLEDDGVAIDVMNDEAPDDLKPTIYHQWMLNHYLLKKDLF